MKRVNWVSAPSQRADASFLTENRVYVNDAFTLFCDPCTCDERTTVTLRYAIDDNRNALLKYLEDGFKSFGSEGN
jgi:hypothetical protein